jgi:hypothetical protein
MMAEVPRLHESWEGALQKRELPPVSSEQREAVRQIVQERIEKSRQAPPATTTPPSGTTVATQDVHPKLAQLKTLDASTQLKFLTHVALEDGVEEAIALVKHLNSEYLIDALHDLLVDELLAIIAARRNRQEKRP